MPTRVSRSTPGQARGSRAGASTSTALPEYEAPISALTSKAKHDLSMLPVRHDMSNLHSRLESAHKQLASIAADVNELATQQRQRMASRTAKGADIPAEESEAYNETLCRFRDMTDALEGEARAVVDRQARMEMQEEVLRELSANVPSQGAARGARGGPSGTQSTGGLTSTQQTQTPTQTANAEADDENPQEPPAVSLLENMRSAMADAEAKYMSLSMRERYSAHNSYVNFRRMLHSAQYPDDAAAPPVPHASTWFDEGTGSPRHLFASGDEGTGGTKSEAGAPPPPPGTQPEAEMDSDIEAVAERTSIRCPLTLLPMKEPVTSARCPHSFEKQAIYEIIQRAGRPARGMPNQAKCPVCEVMLTLADLRSDPTLQRKIARIQAAEARRGAADGEDDDDDDEDDDGRGSKGRGLRPEHITSSSPVQTPRSSRTLRLKRERLSGVPQ